MTSYIQDKVPFAESVTENRDRTILIICLPMPLFN